jgi:hypothetical protein
MAAVVGVSAIAAVVGVSAAGAVVGVSAAGAVVFVAAAGAAGDSVGSGITVAVGSPPHAASSNPITASKLVNSIQVFARFMLILLLWVTPSERNLSALVPCRAAWDRF